MSDNSWEQFVNLCRQEYDQVKRELKEVDMLIQHTSSEVDRFMQTNSRAVARTRQMESAFDTLPREDIKKTYVYLVENQQRLFTMRGQLEKLQSDQRHLTRIAELYQKVLEFTAPMDVANNGMDISEQEMTPQSMVISIIEAQEQERFRLSRQMHDGPAQSLTNLVLQAEICERLFDRDPERAKVELGELKKSVISTFQKVRVFIFDLRPMMLDDLGLTPTIRRYVEGLAESGFDGMTLNISGKDRRIAAHKEVTIFRVIQALIHIGRKQAQASSINIALDLSENQVTVKIECNGNSFELDEALTTADANRLNLPTLRERIEMLEGQISFYSAPGQGLRITFSLPTEPRKE